MAFVPNPDTSTSTESDAILVRAQLQQLAGVLSLATDLISFLTPKVRVNEYLKPVSANQVFIQLAPEHPVAGFRVSITSDTAGTFTMKRTPLSGTQTSVENFNSGTLNASQNYVFDIIVTDDEVVSFLFSANAILQSFKVLEIGAMTI